MLRKLGQLASLLLIVGLVGCQAQPEWTIQQKIDPDPVKIGQKFTASCKVTGELERVGWVSAVPIVAPEFTMELKDDGSQGDAKAGDGVFTVTGTPPAEAEPGLYEIEFVVYNKDGDPLEVPCFKVLDKAGKVMKEVAPKEGEPKDATVEFSAIITVTLE